MAGMTIMFGLFILVCLAGSILPLESFQISTWVQDVTTPFQVVYVIYIYRERVHNIRVFIYHIFSGQNSHHISVLNVYKYNIIHSLYHYIKLCIYIYMYIVHMGKS